MLSASRRVYDRLWVVLLRRGLEVGHVQLARRHIAPYHVQHSTTIADELRRQTSLEEESKLIDLWLEHPCLFVWVIIRPNPTPVETPKPKQW